LIVAFKLKIHVANKDKKLPDIMLRMIKPPVCPIPPSQQKKLIKSTKSASDIN